MYYSQNLQLSFARNRLQGTKRDVSNADFDLEERLTDMNDIAAWEPHAGSLKDIAPPPVRQAAKVQKSCIPDSELKTQPDLNKVLSKAQSARLDQQVLLIEQRHSLREFFSASNEPFANAARKSKLTRRLKAFNNLLLACNEKVKLYKEFGALNLKCFTAGKQILHS